MPLPNQRALLAIEYKQDQVIHDIRNLLGEVYGTGTQGSTILRELVQNADDASAGSLILTVLETGHPDAANPLLRGSALLVYNDGPFREADERGIHRASGGTKQDQPDKVGRFGLGMKSLFHLCEAFVYRGTGPEGELLSLLNPYIRKRETGDHVEDPQHPEWCQLAEDQPLLTAMAETLHQHLQGRAPCNTGGDLLLWIPLRTPAHMDRWEGEQEGLSRYQPTADELRLWLKQPQLLATLLSQCGTLRTIDVCELPRPDSPLQPRLRVTLAGASAQLLSRYKAPADDAQERTLTGLITVEDHEILSSPTRYDMHGLERLEHKAWLEPKQQDADWPKDEVESPENRGRIKRIPRKAVPHGAITMLRTDLGDKKARECRVRWTAFFPLVEAENSERNDQVALIKPEPGLESVQEILLHGYFWPDQGRRALPGITTDDCNNLEPTKKCQVQWNQAVATELTLPLLPRVLAPLLTEAPADSAKKWLTHLLDSQLLKSHKKAIFRTHGLLPRLTETGVRYECVSLENLGPALSVPGWETCPASLRACWWPRLESFRPIASDLKHWPEHVVVHTDWDAPTFERLLTDEAAALLVDADVLEWLQKPLPTLRPSGNTRSENSTRMSSWLTLALSKGTFPRQDPVVKAEARKPLPELRNQWRSLCRSLKLPFIAIPLKAIQEMERLATDGLPGTVLLLPEGQDDQGGACQSDQPRPGDVGLKKSLEKLAHLQTEAPITALPKELNQLIERLLIAFGVREALEDEALAALPLIVPEVSSAESNELAPLSLSALQQFGVVNRLYSTDDEPSRRRVVATGLNLPIYALSPEIRAGLIPASPTQTPVILTVAACHQDLTSPPDARVELLLLALKEGAQDPSTRAALRFLLHGAHAHRDDLTTPLRFAADDTLMAQAEASMGAETPRWAMIAPQLAQHITAQQQHWLGIEPLTQDVILLEEIRTILRKKEPWHFAGTILDRLFGQDKPGGGLEQRFERLRGDLRERPWLPRRGGEGLAPLNLLRFPTELQAELAELRKPTDGLEAVAFPFELEAKVWERAEALVETLVPQPPSERVKRLTAALKQDAISPQLLIAPSSQALPSGLSRESKAWQVLHRFPGWKLVATLADWLQRQNDAKREVNQEQLESLIANLMGRLTGEPDQKTLAELLKLLSQSKPAFTSPMFEYFARLVEYAEQKTWRSQVIKEALLPTRMEEWRSAHEVAWTTGPGDPSRLLHWRFKDLVPAAKPTQTRETESTDFNGISPLKKLIAVAEKWPVPPSTKGALLAVLYWTCNRAYRYSFNYKDFDSLENKLKHLFGSPEIAEKLFAKLEVIAHCQLSGCSVLAASRNQYSATNASGEQLTISGESEFSLFHDIQVFPPSSLYTTARNIHLSIYLPPPTEPLPKLIAAFKSSTRYLFEKLEFRLKGQAFDPRLSWFDDWWSEHGASAQSQLGPVHEAILDNPESMLRALSAHEHPKLAAWLEKWRNLKQDEYQDRDKMNEVISSFQYAQSLRSSTSRVLKWQYEWANTQISSSTILLRQQIELRNEIKALLTGDADIQKFLRTALQRKLREHSYEASSVLLELLQNADDALEQLATHRAEDTLKAEVEIQYDPHSRILTFKHWGRPINDALKTGRTDWTNDLYSLLLLNQSSKPAYYPESGSQAFTGHFGLGFKSVHLICDEPEVESGYLAFKIVAGFLPKRIPFCSVEQEVDGIRPTLIRLKLRDDVAPETLFTRLQELAALIPLMSRRIRRLSILGPLSPGVWEWSKKTWTLAPNLEAWELSTVPEDVKPGFLRFSAPEEGARLLIPAKIGEDQYWIDTNPLPYPILWNVMPTEERWNLGYLLSAPFDLNSGRLSVHLTAPRTATIFDALGSQLSHCLREYYDSNAHDFYGELWRQLATGLLQEDAHRRSLLLKLHGPGRGLLGWMESVAIAPSELLKPFSPTLPLLTKELRLRVADRSLESQELCSALCDHSELAQFLSEQSLVSEKWKPLFELLLQTKLERMTLKELLEEWLNTCPDGPRLSETLENRTLLESLRSLDPLAAELVAARLPASSAPASPSPSGMTALTGTFGQGLPPGLSLPIHSSGPSPLVGSAAASLQPGPVLEGIARWWQQQHKTITALYEQRLYPEFFRPRELKSALENDAASRHREAWLLLLTLGLCQQWIPRKGLGAERGFLQTLLENGTWSSLTGPEASDWTKALSQWLETGIDHRRFDFWLILFPWLYQLQRHQQAFASILLEAPRLIETGQFGILWQPRRNPKLEGYPHLRVPPLNALYGLGGRWVLRELVRLQVIPPAAAAALAPECFVHRRAVRLFLARLGLPEEKSHDKEGGSRAIYDFLSHHLPGDPSFGGSFDLPLLWLALHPALKEAALNGSLQIQASTSPEAPESDQELELD